MKKLFHVLVLVVLASCFGSSDKEISEDDFVEIMTKLHLSDAIKEDVATADLFEHPDSVDMHSIIWKEYGYTKAEFDSTIRWYSRHPKQLNEIYQKVLANLTDLEAPLVDENYQKDTIVYKDTTSYLVFGNDIPEDFNVKIPDMGIGIYTVRVVAQVYDNDKTYKPGIILYAKNLGQEKTYYNEPDNYRGYVKDGKRRVYTVNVTIRDMETETYFTDVLFIPKADGSDQSHVEISDIEIRYRP